MKLKTIAMTLIAGMLLVSSVYARDEKTTDQQDKGAGQSGEMQNGGGTQNGGGQSAVPMTEVVILEIQQKLNDQGHSVGTPDGKMGPSTQKAISDFQKAKGIPQTGQPDQQTLNALGIDPQSAGKGGSGQQTPPSNGQSQSQPDQPGMSPGGGESQSPSSQQGQ